MSTLPLSAVAVIPMPDWAVCEGCGQHLFAPVDDLPVLCPDCQWSQADAEARKLFSHLKDLVCGRGIFRPLSAMERASLLLSMRFTPEGVAPFMDDQGLIDVIANPKSSEGVVEACAGELSRRLGGIPGAEDRLPRLAELVPAPVAAPAAVASWCCGDAIGSEAPPADVRAALEAEDEQQHRERTIDLETSHEVGDRWDGLA